jgi:hypothetical protein
MAAVSSTALFGQIIQQLLETNKQLSEQIIQLSSALAEAKAEPVVAPVQYEESLGPLHIPESEEDAHYLLERGLIDKSEYEDVLKEIGFYNAEITVPTSL